MNQENNEHNSVESQELTPKINPATAAFISLVAIFLLYQIGGAIVTVSITGLNFEKADANILRITQIAGQFFFMLVPAIFFSRLFYNQPVKLLRLRMPDLKMLLLFTGSLIVLVPVLEHMTMLQEYFLIKWAENNAVMHELKEFIDQLFKMLEGTMIKLLTAENYFENILVIFTVALTPAVCEEIAFRGLFQRSLELRFKPRLAILFSGLFFALFHFNLMQLIPLIIIGAFFGYSAYKTDSIITPVILHFLNNLYSVSVFFVMGKEVLNEFEILTYSPLNSVLIVLGGLVIFGILMYLISNPYRREAVNEKV